MLVDDGLHLFILAECGRANSSSRMLAANTTRLNSGELSLIDVEAWQNGMQYKDARDQDTLPSEHPIAAHLGRDPL